MGGESWITGKEQEVKDIQGHSKGLEFVSENPNCTKREVLMQHSNVIQGSSFKSKPVRLGIVCDNQIWIKVFFPMHHICQVIFTQYIWMQIQKDLPLCKLKNSSKRLKRAFSPFPMTFLELHHWVGLQQNHPGIRN